MLSAELQSIQLTAFQLHPQLSFRRRKRPSKLSRPLVASAVGHSVAPSTAFGGPPPHCCATGRKGQEITVSPPLLRNREERPSDNRLLPIHGEVARTRSGRDGGGVSTREGGVDLSTTWWSPSPFHGEELAALKQRDAR
ncbi:hypothetical protein FQZ97_1003850 [compost metagenome]